MSENPLESEFLQSALDQSEFLEHRMIELMDHPEILNDQAIMLEYLHVLFAFLEKEQMIYIRLQPLEKSDERVKEVLDTMRQEMLNRNQDDYASSLTEFYYRLKEDVKRQIKLISGEDLDEPTDD